MGCAPIEAAIVEVSISDTSSIGVEMAAVDGSGNSVPLVTTTLDGVISALIGNLLGEDSDIDVLTGLASLSSLTFAVTKINASGISFAAVVPRLAWAGRPRRR